MAPSILEFYPTVGVKRDVNSKPEASLYALRGLLSVRYTLVPKEKVEDWEKEKLEGWNLVSSTTSYLIYENENWVPMGFTYDSYITEENFETVSDTHAGNVLMKALLLTDEQVERYGQMMQNLTDDEKNNISYEDYVQDCTARRATVRSCSPTTRPVCGRALPSAPALLWCMPCGWQYCTGKSAGKRAVWGK